MCGGLCHQWTDAAIRATSCQRAANLVIPQAQQRAPRRVASTAQYEIVVCRALAQARQNAAVQINVPIHVAIAACRSPQPSSWSLTAPRPNVMLLNHLSCYYASSSAPWSGRMREVMASAVLCWSPR